jgi:hypothetical protein
MKAWLFVVALQLSLRAGVAEWPGMSTNVALYTPVRALPLKVWLNYAPDPASYEPYRGQGPYETYSPALLAALNAPECAPVEDDPEGNWGEMVDGLRLSLRFQPRSITNGTPLVAVVILRNVTNREIQWTALDGIQYTAERCGVPRHAGARQQIRVARDSGMG